MLEYEDEGGWCGWDFVLDVDEGGEGYGDEDFAMVYWSIWACFLEYVCAYE